MIVVGELLWWCRQSFFELAKVKLNHSCILAVTVERLFFLSLPLPFCFSLLHCIPLESHRSEL